VTLLKFVYVCYVLQDEVLTVFERVGLSSDEACNIVLGDSCSKGYDPWHQKWRVPIPGDKPPVTHHSPEPGSPVTGVLHITDIHYDPLYTPGLTHDCGEPLCCRPPNAQGNSSTAAGYWGDYKCDLPYRTLLNLMEHLQKQGSMYEWVYWTGDMPAHSVWTTTRQGLLDMMTNITGLMNTYFGGKPVFPTFGNHEGAPVNSFPPPYITGNMSAEWLYSGSAERWAVWLDKFPEWPTINATIRKGGYYVVKVTEHLKVISLQTNFCNTGNYWLLINSTDPAGQLQWLVEQLLQAERDGDKVNIIGHIFPSSYMKEFGWNYHKIVTRFESTITGQFFGHTHQDSWQVFFDDSNRTRATNVAYMGPAVTTYQGLNLGFRIYTMDGGYNGTSNALLDHESYWLNLTEANLKDKAEWKFEYSAKEAYGLESLQPQEWARLIDRFKTDDALFQKFWDYKYKMHAGPCDAGCRASAICGLQRTRTGSPFPCTDLPPGMTMDDVLRHLAKDIMC
jgi:sphingomyelin phosphodiesterase